MLTFRSRLRWKKGCRSSCRCWFSGTDGSSTAWAHATVCVGRFWPTNTSELHLRRANEWRLHTGRVNIEIRALFWMFFWMFWPNWAFLSTLKRARVVRAYYSQCGCGYLKRISLQWIAFQRASTVVKVGPCWVGPKLLRGLRADKWSVYTSPTTLPIDLHKRCLYAIMIFITEVWSDLCKLTTYQLLNL